MSDDRPQHIDRLIHRDGWLLYPSPWVIRDVLSSRLIIDGNIHVVMLDETVQAISNEFTVASQLVDLADSDDIYLRNTSTRDTFHRDILVTDRAIGSYISVPQDRVFVGTDDIDTSVYVGAARDVWNHADDVSLPTPSETHVFDAVSTYISRSMYQDFWELNYVIEEQALAASVDSDQLFTSDKHVFAAFFVAGAMHDCTVDELTRAVTDIWDVSDTTIHTVQESLVDNNIITISDGTLAPSSRIEPINFAEITYLLPDYE